MARLGLERLEDRWRAAFGRFALKLEFDVRFSRYIQPRLTAPSLRSSEPYFVWTAGSAQRQQAPLRAVVIHLNSLASTPEQRKAEAEKAALKRN